jgi:ABC-2 type transport system ATP-binding protein
MTTALAEVSGLQKRYRRRRVLTGVSFAVPSGAMVGIEGENGAGKSTLLKILVGLLKPDAGKVLVHGRLGYCPQDPTLLEALTMTEHLRLFGAGYRMSPTDTDRRVRELAAVFSCTKDLDTRISLLSGGTAQKVNLIGALLHDPGLLVLDEPYQGFDHTTYTTFWQYAEDHCVDGGSVLVVSHMHAERDRFDVLMQLADGMIDAVGPRAAEARRR